MATGGMSPNEVKSTVNGIDKSEKTTNSKAVMSGCRLGEKSGSGNLKESPFKGSPKPGNNHG